ncbi:MAG: PKD domain-containing protein, partial [Pirellulales bacterium]
SSNASIASRGWDLNGDNIFSDATGSTPTLIWSNLVALGIDDDGTYSIAYRVEDDGGSVAIDTTTLVVTNKAPTITASSAAASIGAGLPLTVTFSATDPGDDLVSGWTIDWKDGTPDTPGSGAIGATHVYDSIGAYDITVTATDEDGDTTVALATVTVTPVNPTTSSSLNIAEGDGLTIQVDAAGSTSAGVDLDGGGVAVAKTSASGLVEFTWSELEAAGITNDGTHSITLLANYATSQTSSTVSLVVDDTAPTATLTVSPSVTNEGGSITATVTGATDVSTADVTAGFEYRFDIDNSGAFTGWNSTASTTFTATQAGTQVVRAQVRVNNDNGEVADLFGGVTIAEVAPTLSLVSLPVNGIVDEGQTYTLNLSSTDPGADAITEWVVECGDGNTSTVSAAAGSPTHTYADDGVFDVRVTAFDNDGIYQATTTVTVINVAPTVTVTPQQASAQEASVFSFDLNVSGDPGDDEIIDFVIDWGDGTDLETLPGYVVTVVELNTDPPTTEFVVSPRTVIDHVYADNGTYTVSVTASDEDTSVTATTDATVTNVAPTAEITATEGAVEGSTVSLTVDSSDPGDDTVSQIVVDWADGSDPETLDVSSLPLVATHIYADNGAYDVAVSLVDEDGTHAPVTKTVTIANVAPTFGALADVELLPPVAGSLNLSIPIIDPGDDVWSGTVNYGDNTGDQVLAVDQAAKTFDLGHTYTQDGTFTVTVNLSDDDGGSHSDSFAVAVQLNTPPVAMPDAISVNEDGTVTFSVLTDNGNGADSDAESNINPALTVNLSLPSAGLLTNNNDGTFSYDPNGAFDDLDEGDSAT